GASGAGRAPTEKLHFAEVNENCRAYGLFTHRHIPEMLQALGLEERNFTFTPHLLPITRGILSTVYARLRERRAVEEIVALFRDFYGAAPLVRVYDSGLTETLARLNIPTTFRQGLRVTDAATRDVALMVLAGIINKQWVAELQGRGVPALGICGGDANLIEARKLRLRTNGRSENLGFVGRPRKVNP